jgi:hypothetical protein
MDLDERGRVCRARGTASRLRGVRSRRCVFGDRCWALRSRLSLGAIWGAGRCWSRIRSMFRTSERDLRARATALLSATLTLMTTYRLLTAAALVVVIQSTACTDSDASSSATTDASSTAHGEWCPMVNGTCPAACQPIYGDPWDATAKCFGARELVACGYGRDASPLRTCRINAGTRVFYSFDTQAPTEPDVPGWQQCTGEGPWFNSLATYCAR